MATPAQRQRALVEQHRQAQLANRAAFLTEFLAAWGLLDVTNLDAVTPNWLRIVTRLVRLFRQDSANLALNHYRDMRRLGAPDTDLGMPDIDFELGNVVERAARQRRAHPDASVPALVRREVRDLRIPGRQSRVTISWDRADRAVDASLQVTGPVNIKSQVKRGETPERAARKAFVDASGAASRHVQNGGRSTLLTLVQNDQRALGWIRVTDNDPCAFCAMLASRGITWGPYAPESFKQSNEKFSGRKFESEHDNDPRVVKRGEVQVHDHCACGVAVVFSRQDGILDQGKQFRQLWDNHISGKYGGKDAINAWRRLHERPDVFKDKQRDARRAQAA